MLSSTATSPSQTSYGNPRQIATRATSFGVVMYTVPAGKKFQGAIYNNTTGQEVTITPAGGVSTTFGNLPTSFPSTSNPVTLVAGSIVTSGSNITYIIGVETDA